MCTSAKTPADVVHQEHHRCHQCCCHQRVLTEENKDGGRGNRLLLRLRNLRILVLGRPTSPAGEGQQQRQQGQPKPGLLQAIAQQPRHQARGTGDTQADAEKDRATGQPTPRGRDMGQDCAGRQYHDHPASHPGQ
ncbi:hypothetical protein D3C76_839610 [compost metagenome]